MEYAAGGDMFQRVKACGGLKEDDARWFFQQLIIGLDYCHKVCSGSFMLVEHMFACPRIKSYLFSVSPWILVQNAWQEPVS